MKWKSYPKREAQLKVVQDKSEGKKESIVHTQSALVSNLENVNDQHLMGKFEVRGAGWFPLPLEVLERICFPALCPIIVIGKASPLHIC